MNKKCEDYLWKRIHIYFYCKSNGYKTPRDIIEEMLLKEMIKTPKQAWATLEKWSGKGLYEYGVCLDLGWRLKDAR